MIYDQHHAGRASPGRIAGRAQRKIHGIGQAAFDIERMPPDPFQVRQKMEAVSENDIPLVHGAAAFRTGIMDTALFIPIDRGDRPMPLTDASHPDQGNHN